MNGSHVHEVAIVGAGFGGLGMAIRLKQEGIEDFVVLERGADVGGTWWANSYPGCQCDIPSNLYSFSFARYDWDRAYPMRDQILEYLRDCAQRFGVLPHTRLNCELLGATWVADAQHWELETSDGPLAARVLVTAPGLLSEPWSPALPGLERFKGNAFHTARWDHADDLQREARGARGIGRHRRAGGAEHPAAARQAAPVPAHAALGGPALRPSDPAAVRKLYRRLPPLQALSRAVIYALRETFVPGITRNPRFLALQAHAARAHLRRQVPDPELRRRLTPELPHLLQADHPLERVVSRHPGPNVDIVSSGIREVREHSVVDNDGIEREIDTLIFATGFRPAELPIAERVRGRDGSSLAEVWAGSPQAYLGTTVSGFPNLFLFYGPNLNLGHSSIVYMLESQTNYAIDGLRTMRARGAAEFEVRAEVQEAYNEELQDRLARTVWNTGGCGSWYFDGNGRNSIQWPGFTFEFRRRTRRFDAAAYKLAAPTTLSAGNGASRSHPPTHAR